MKGEMIDMGIHMKSTTAGNLQKAINDNLVIVTNAQTECKDTHEVETITPEQFVEDLDFYMEVFLVKKILLIQK